MAIEVISLREFPLAMIVTARNCQGFSPARAFVRAANGGECQLRLQREIGCGAHANTARQLALHPTRSPGGGLVWIAVRDCELVGSGPQEFSLLSSSVINS